MAEAINNYVEEYKEAIPDTRNLLGKIDLTTPQANVIEADPATMTLLKIQAETEAEAIGETLNFIKNNIPHLAADIPGHTPLSVADQNAQLDNICKKNFLATRMLQQRQQENQRKLEGEDFDDKSLYVKFHHHLLPMKRTMSRIRLSNCYLSFKEIRIRKLTTCSSSYAKFLM